MRTIRAVAVLPTLFTLGNLVCGFFAIVVLSRIEKPLTTQIEPSTPIKISSLAEAKSLIESEDPTHNLMLCGLLILLAMIFDAVDGQIARITRGESDFGVQLDSLCDLVSFGLAPAILLVKMCPQFTNIHSEAIWSVAALFACCAALRLARFNVETDNEDDHTMFAGLPTPAAAACIASFAILSYSLRNEVALERHQVFAVYDSWMQRLLPFFSIVIAVLMVSRIPYPHPLSQFLRGQRTFAQMVAIVFSLMAVLIVRNYAIPLLCVLFVLAPPLRYAWELVRHRRANKEPLFQRHAMFTGLVEFMAEVAEVVAERPGVRLVIREPRLAAGAKIGDSFALNGCCLTVVSAAGDRVAFQAGEETLSRTNLGQLVAGSRVNIEQSLRAGDPLGGHYVTGHIDGLGTLDERRDDDPWSTIWFRAPAALLRQMASKGSVAVDGVSLTLVDVNDTRFSVALIPHTLSVTTLGQRQVGDLVNLETDVLAKYVERQLSREQGAQSRE